MVLQVLLFSPERGQRSGGRNIAWSESAEKSCASSAWQGVNNMVTQKQFQKAVDHIRGMRFHSSLDYSDEVSRDTCEELLKDVLTMLKIEVEK